MANIENLTLSNIRKVRDKHFKGELSFIPCTIPFFSRDYSGVGKKSITIITASTSQGKTSFFKFMLFNLIENAIKHNIKCKFIYFLLEEDEEKFYHSILGYLMYKKFGIRLSTVEFSGRKIDSNGKLVLLSEDELLKVESLENDVKSYLSYIIYYTNVNQPSLMYTIVKEYCRNKIKYYDKGKLLTIEEIEQGHTFDVVEDTDEIVVPIFDHISLAKLKGKEKYEVIENLKFYCKTYMEKILHCHVFYIQQNSKASGTPESIKQELYFASLTNLSDNKSTSDDAYDVISVTLPNFYDVKKWRGYDVEKLRNGLSVIFLAKARYGLVNRKIPFFFDGKANHYELLPSTKNPEFEELIEPYYERIENFYK